MKNTILLKLWALIIMTLLASNGWGFETNQDSKITGDLEVTGDLKRPIDYVFGTFDALGAGTRHEEQSEKARGEIDQCIAKLINIAQIKAVEILHERENDLKILSDKLLKNGSVTGDDVP